MQVGQAWSRCAALPAMHRHAAVVLYLGVAHLQSAVGEDRVSRRCSWPERQVLRCESQRMAGGGSHRLAHELQSGLSSTNTCWALRSRMRRRQVQVIGQEHVGEVLELLALDDSAWHTWAAAG